MEDEEYEDYCRWILGGTLYDEHGSDFKLQSIENCTSRLAPRLRACRSLRCLQPALSCLCQSILQVASGKNEEAGREHSRM